jgi:hypothetical protein
LNLLVETKYHTEENTSEENDFKGVEVVRATAGFDVIVECPRVLWWQRGSLKFFHQEPPTQAKLKQRSDSTFRHTNIRWIQLVHAAIVNRFGNCVNWI